MIDSRVVPLETMAFKAALKVRIHGIYSNEGVVGLLVNCGREALVGYASSKDNEEQY